MKKKEYANWKLLNPLRLIVLMLIFQSNLSFAQNPFCVFDEVMNSQMESELEGIFMENEMLMQQEMTENPQAIMNGVVYEVPVIYHVIHLGEAQGVGSNIPTADVIATGQQLNDHFRDVLNVGYDVEIEFCLAKRDAHGNSTDGINRVDGSSIISYATFGINSANEAEVKALSPPSEDCINIWIVHNIQSPPGGEILGYATFPGTPVNLDGIVLKASVVGSTTQSGVVTHEMGHFFDLYHTFQGSNNYNDCPLNDDCENHGDRLCDTRAHPYMNETGNWFPCDESQYTSCDPNFVLPFQVVENHMNYTPNSCRDEFTPDQAMRMRCALMTLRPELLSSLCCVAVCDEAIADFTSSAILIDIGESITFTNTSTGAEQSEWTVEGNIFNTTDLTYQFDNFGTFDVCLTVSGSGCVNRRCVTIEVTCEGQPSCDIEVDCNNLVANGDFSLNCVGANSSDLKNGPVCNWRVKHSSPKFCTDVNGSDAMVMADWDEAIVTEEPVPLEFGKNYKLTFEYYRINSVADYEDTELAFGFDYNHQQTQKYPFSNNTYTLLETLSNTPYDQKGSYDECFGEDDVQFHYYEKKFKYDGEELPHLFFSFRDFGVATPFLPSSYIQIRNIAIMCCDVVASCSPLPDFTYDVDCPKEFIGTNDGDGDQYSWTFSCDGSIHYGPNVTLDLPVGECEVCLTIFCDLETSETICKTVTIPEESEVCEDECTDLDIPLQTCIQEAEQENSFVANFDLTVPDGTGPCDGVAVISNSAFIDISLTSIFAMDDPGNAGMDIISIGIEVSAPVGFDLLNTDVAGSIMLCDPDGKVICYNLTFSGEECVKCLGEISSVADCIDPDPSDDTFVYEGSITLNLPIDGAPFETCDPTSSQAGYSHEVFQNGNDVLIEYEISTETIGNFTNTTILCFLIDEEQYCLTFNINVNPCPPPTGDCIEWPDKVADATDCEVVDGKVTYVVEMNGVVLNQSGGLRPCDGGLYGTIGAGGTVEVSGNTISAGTQINYIANITMPCGFDTSIPYDLVLYVCDGDGNVYCLVFVIRFPDCDIDCDDRGGERSGKSAYLNGSGHEVKVYPNPTLNTVNIEIGNIDSEQHAVQIFDHLGSLVVLQKFERKTELDVSSFSAGVYLMKIIDKDKKLIGIEKLVVMK